MNALTISLGIIQIVLQLAIAGFSFHIYLMARSSKFWIPISLGFLIMAIRRITAVMIELNMIDPLQGIISDLDRIYLPFLITILISIGIFSLWVKVAKQNEKQ